MEVLDQPRSRLSPDPTGYIAIRQSSLVLSCTFLGVQALNTLKSLCFGLALPNATFELIRLMHPTDPPGACRNSASFAFKRRGCIAWPSCSKLLLFMEPDLLTSADPPKTQGLSAGSWKRFVSGECLALWYPKQHLHHHTNTDIM